MSKMWEYGIISNEKDERFQLPHKNSFFKLYLLMVVNRPLVGFVFSKVRTMSLKYFL